MNKSEKVNNSSRVKESLSDRPGRSKIRHPSGTYNPGVDINVFIMGYVTFSLGCYMVCGSVASLAVGYIYLSCSHLYSFASYDRHYALKNYVRR